LPGIFSHHAFIHPLEKYLALNELSPNPFSCFYKVNHQYLLCASPERFIKKHGNEIIAQPIKGTMGRDIQNPAKDKALKQQLAHSAKDLSEKCNGG